MFLSDYYHNCVQCIAVIKFTSVHMQALTLQHRFYLNLTRMQIMHTTTGRGSQQQSS
jgi:hypothetical protein